MASPEVILPNGVTQVDCGPVAVAYSGTEFGNVDVRFDSPPSVATERQRRLYLCLGVSQLALEEVQMGSEVTDLSDIADEDLDERHRVDGLIINRPGIALGLNPADCNAMTIYDKTGGVTGLIHVGRQGVDGDIHLSSLTYLMDRHGVAPENIGVHFGPSIRKDSYRFPQKIAGEVFADPKWKQFIDVDPNDAAMCNVDLLTRVVREITDSSMGVGVDPANIEIIDVDTGADTGYFSHSRSGRTGEPYGRNGHVVALKAHWQPELSEG